MQFTDFVVTAQGNLQITLKPQGKTRLQELLHDHPKWTDDEILVELIDEHLTDTWMIIAPEQIRAVQNLLILSDSVRYDAEGNIVQVEKAYWYPHSQLGIVSKILLQQGYVIFESGKHGA